MITKTIFFIFLCFLVVHGTYFEQPSDDPADQYPRESSFQGSRYESPRPDREPYQGRGPEIGPPEEVDQDPSAYGNADDEPQKERERTIFNPKEGGNLEDFLAKYPPSTTMYEDTPWIQLVKENSFDPKYDPDGAVNYFARKTAGMKFNPKSKHFIRRLKTMITDIGEKYHVTLGKWMLLFSPDDIDEQWNTIARALYNGDLGSAVTAKVAPKGHPYGHLICVYSSDFDDLDDVMKLRDELSQLGFNDPLDYKSDIYTLLGIYENNKFGLPENIYHK
jgi:hypothetical protein